MKRKGIMMVMVMLILTVIAEGCSTKESKETASTGKAGSQTPITSEQPVKNTSTVHFHRTFLSLNNDKCS